MPAQHPVYLKIPLQLLPDAPNAHCLSAVFETMIVNPVVPNRFGIDPSQNALCGRLIPKRRIFAPFWDLPIAESIAGHANPKTIWNNCTIFQKYRKLHCRFRSLMRRVHPRCRAAASVRLFPDGKGRRLLQNH